MIHPHIDETHRDIVGLGLGVGAEDARGRQAHCMAADAGVGVRGIPLSGGPAIPEVPLPGGEITCGEIGEMDRQRDTANGGGP